MNNKSSSSFYSILSFKTEDNLESSYIRERLLICNRENNLAVVWHARASRMLRKRWCWYKAITLYQRRHEATLRYAWYHKGATFRLLRDVRTRAAGRTYSKYLEVASTITQFDKNVVRSTTSFESSLERSSTSRSGRSLENALRLPDSFLSDTFFRLRASTHRLNILRVTRHMLIDLRTTAKHSRPGDNETW